MLRSFIIVCMVGAALALHCAAQSVAEQYLFAAANAERAHAGLAGLRWDTSLANAAQGHAHEMAARQTISHKYPGEPELQIRAAVAGAKFNMVAENVAEAPTAVGVHDAWMQSPGHRANILDGRVDAVGISVVRRGSQLFAVQDFARSVAMLSLSEQEAAIGSLLQGASKVKSCVGLLRSTRNVRAGEWVRRRAAASVRDAVDSG